MGRPIPEDVGEEDDGKGDDSSINRQTAPSAGPRQLLLSTLRLFADGRMWLLIPMMVYSGLSYDISLWICCVAWRVGWHTEVSNRGERGDAYSCDGGYGVDKSSLEDSSRR